MHPSVSVDEMQPTSAPMLRVMTVGAHALFVLLLGLGVARVVADGSSPVVTTAVAVALLGWYGSGMWFARKADPTGDSSWGRFWLAILVAGWLLLVALDPSFVWVAFPLYFLCFHLLSTRAALAATVGITAAAIGGSLWHGASNPVASVLGPIFGAAASAGMALVYQQLLENARQRGKLYEELSIAHNELLSAQDELAALQREAGAAEERARLARDIHDTLAQGFSSIVLLARAGQRGDPVAVLGQIEETASGGLDEARRVVGALTPAVMDGASLVSALDRVTAQLRDHTGIDATVVVDGAPVPVPMEYDVALLRVAQGALANVRLHSAAERVRVTLSYAEDEVRLDVVDDGVGFDPDAPRGRSFGIRSMRERLDSLGGSLVVESAPGDGTALAATLPVPS
ncbi:Two component system sensor kinase [Rhodococcus sp. RD6.2]|nr:Two component system sensor kinase [Rhodococcus sp. RD6.2]